MDVQLLNMCRKNTQMLAQKCVIPCNYVITILCLVFVGVSMTVWDDKCDEGVTRHNH